jgi:hypothetical protein
MRPITPARQTGNQRHTPPSTIRIEARSTTNCCAPAGAMRPLARRDFFADGQTQHGAPCMMGQDRHKERYRRMCIAMGTGKIKWDKLNAAQPFKFYPPIVEQSCRWRNRAALPGYCGKATTSQQSDR